MTGAENTLILQQAIADEAIADEAMFENERAKLSNEILD